MIESGFKSDRGMFVRVSRVLVFLVAVFVCTSIVICPAHAEDSSTPSRFNEADESSGQDLGTQGAQPTNGQPGRELAGERSSSRDVTLSNAATPVGTDSSASKNESSAKPEADDSKADASAQQKPVKKPIKPEGQALDRLDCLWWCLVLAATGRKRRDGHVQVDYRQGQGILLDFLGCHGDRLGQT